MVEFSRSPDGSGWQLQSQIQVPQSIETVFDFFGDAANLEAITPASLRFRIITPQPIEMAAGTLIDYRLSLRGVPIRWRTEISVWDRPQRFVDRQVRGPYRLWEHTHTFEPTDVGTMVYDRVEYRAPGGGWIHRRFVQPELRKIFQFRHDRLAELLGRVDATGLPASTNHTAVQ